MFSPSPQHSTPIKHRKIRSVCLITCPSQISVAFCSPAESLILSGLMGHPIGWHKQFRTSIPWQNAPKKSHCHGNSCSQNKKNQPRGYRLRLGFFSDPCLHAIPALASPDSKVPEVGGVNFGEPLLVGMWRTKRNPDPF